MSKTQKPHIGISACFFHADPKRAIFKGKTLLYLEDSLSQWILEGGATAAVIPQLGPFAKVTLKEVVEGYDGLVLQGGSDVSPKSYGETPIKPEWNGDYHRDLYEIALLKEFAAQGKPVLGVCRGLQLMNVAFGGTLYQDLDLQLKTPVEHRNWDIYDDNHHEVEFAPGSFLEKLYGSVRTHLVNSVHHQAIKDLGGHLEVMAKCPKDGVIEAVRHNQYPFMMAVQWHPEFTSRQHLTQNTASRGFLDPQVLLQAFLKEIP